MSVPGWLYFTIPGDEEAAEQRARDLFDRVPMMGIHADIEGVEDAIIWLGPGDINVSPNTIEISIEEEWDD
jgi:hypothetical protein